MNVDGVLSHESKKTQVQLHDRQMKSSSKHHEKGQNSGDRANNDRKKSSTVVEMDTRINEKANSVSKQYPEAERPGPSQQRSTS